MIVTGTMASIEYYLQGQEDNLNASKKTANRKGSYYEDGKDTRDILHRPLKAWGPAAQRLGLVPGSTVSAAQFTNLYLGFSPDGRRALGRYPKDIAAAEEKLKALNEKKTLRTERAEKAYASALERSGGDHGAAALNPKVLRARATLEKTIDEIRTTEAKLERLRDLCVPETSRDEQVAASKRIHGIEKTIEQAKADANEAYRTALKKGYDQTAASLDPAVVEAKRRVEEGKAKLDVARSDPAYRRPGTDVVYSLPAGVSVLWARLMADGRTADAKKIEELFEKSVQGSMQRLAATCTTSSGRDIDGKRMGEPVECSWNSVMHFDARPDELGVVSPMLHCHNTLFNMGITKDGEWSAIRTEGIKEIQEAESARVEAEVVRGCVALFGVVPSPKEHLSGVLGVEFGDGRRLDEMSQRGEDVFLFGRGVQARKNEARGVSSSQANRVGRAAKKEMTGQEFIDYQRGLLDAHGLTMETLKDGLLSLHLKDRQKTESELRKEYENTIKAWNEYERKNGWPNGRPDPYQGPDARRYAKFLKTTGEKRKKPGGDKIPSRPRIPPGEPGHSEKAWNDAIIKGAAKKDEARFERTTLSAAHIVETLTQTKAAFTETELRAEVARRLQFSPLKLTPAERRRLSPEKIMEMTEREISRVCESVTTHATVSSENGKKVYVSNILIEDEKNLVANTLPSLFKRDKRVLNTSEEKAREFVKAYEKKQGFPFSDKQFEACVSVLTGTTRAQFILGWAGSGKSTAFGSIVSGLYDLVGYKTVIACAPSNNAADGLMEAAGTDKAYTPQRLLLDYSNGKIRIDSKTLIVLDEVSLLDIRTAAHLCEVVEKTGARIIFSGDPAQLESVGAGNFLELMQSVAQEKDAEDPADRFIALNSEYSDASTIQRQKTMAGKQISALMQIGDFGAAIRQMRSQGLIETSKTREDAVIRMVEEYARIIDENKRETPHFIAEYEKAKRSGADEAQVAQARENMIESIERSAAGFAKVVMLAETNADVKFLGAASRAALKKIGVLGKEDRMITGYDGEPIPVALGERLILRDHLKSRNALNLEREGFSLVKGTEMHVVGMRDENGSLVLSCLIVGENAKKVGRVEIRAEDFQGLGAAYSRTTHLSQGGSWDNALFLGSGGASRNLFLVAMTRWKTSTKIFATDDVLKKIKEKVTKVTRRRNALDYDGIAEADLNEAIELVRKAPKQQAEDVGKEAVRRATDIFAGAIKPPAADLDDIARKLRGVAKAHKREELEKALELGIVRGEAVGTRVTMLGVELPFRSRNVKIDKRNWIAHSETEIFAYNKLTGRVEAHPIEAAGEARLNLAKRSTLQPMFEEAIRDARKNAEQPKAPAETAEAPADAKETPVAQEPSAETNGSETEKPAEPPKPAEKPKNEIRGVLVASGEGPYMDKKGGKKTAWAKILKDDGNDDVRWGVEIGKALARGNVEPGDYIRLNGDTTQIVTVFSASETDDSVSVEATLVSPRREGVPAVVSIDGREVEIFGPETEKWDGLEKDAPVEVHKIETAKRLWIAEKVEREEAPAPAPAEQAKAQADGASAESGEVAEAKERVASPNDIRGTLLETGRSAFKDVKGAKVTPWALILRDDDSTIKVWGADIERAIRAAGVKPGDGVSLNGDATKTVSVFSASEKEGAERLEGVLVTPPDDGGPAVVRIGKQKVRVYGADAQAWADMEGGEKVEVFEKKVERRDWKAEQIQARNRLDENKRKAAWTAAKAAVASDEVFSRLQGIGVGEKTSRLDDEPDARRRAIRAWTADGDEKGEDAVVAWDACLGEGRRAWQEVGFSKKDESGKLRSEFACVALHDDGDRVYVAAALENAKGEIESAGTRILAFEKADLGLAGPVQPGAAMKIRCSEGADKPELVQGGDDTAGKIREDYEKAARNEEAREEAGILDAQNGLLDIVSRMSDDAKAALIARSEKAELAKPDAEATDRGFESLTEVGSIADILPKKTEKAEAVEAEAPTEAEEAKVEEAKTEATEPEARDDGADGSAGSVEAVPAPTAKMDEARERAEREEAARAAAQAELETRQKLTAESVEKTRREQREANARSAEEAARIVANARAERARRAEEARADRERRAKELEETRLAAIEKARIAAEQQAAQEKADEEYLRAKDAERREQMSAMWTDLLEKIDPSDKTGILNCLKQGANPHLSDKAFEVAMGFLTETKDYEKINNLLDTCDPARSDRLGALLNAGADESIATRNGIPADFVLSVVEKKSDRILAHCLENGASAETARLGGYARGRILANLPGDSKEARKLIGEMLDSGDGDFWRRGADGLTFEERATRVEESDTESERAYLNLEAIQTAQDASGYGRSGSSGGYSQAPTPAPQPKPKGLGPR